MPSCMRAPPEALTVISAARACGRPIGRAGDLLADDAAHAGAHEREVEHHQLDRQRRRARRCPPIGGFALAGLRVAVAQLAADSTRPRRRSRAGRPAPARRRVRRNEPSSTSCAMRSRADSRAWCSHLWQTFRLFSNSRTYSSSRQCSFSQRTQRPCAGGDSRLARVARGGPGRDDTAALCETDCALQPVSRTLARAEPRVRLSRSCSRPVTYGASRCLSTPRDSL